MSPLNIAVTVYGTVVLLLILIKPKQGFYLLIPLIPFIFILPSTGVRGLNGWTIVILAGLGITLFLSAGQRRPSHQRDPLLLPLCLFIVMIFFSLGIGFFTLKGPYYSAWSALIDVKRFLLFLLLYFIYFHNITDRRGIDRAVDFLLIGIAAEAIFALYAVFKLQANEILEAASSPSEEFVAVEERRVVGTALGPNPLAYLLVLSVPLILVRLIEVKRLFRWLVYSGLLGLVIFIIAWTKSRGGYLALVFAILMLAYQKSKITFAVLLLAGAFVGVNYKIVLPDVVKERIELTFTGHKNIGFQGMAGTIESSAGSRIVLAKMHWDSFKESPLWGSGWHSFRIYTLEKRRQYGLHKTWKASHNLYLRILSEMGLIGLVLLLWICVVIVKAPYYISRYAKSTHDRNLAIAGFTSLVTLLLSMNLGTHLLLESVSGYFWILSALMIRLMLIVREEKRERVAAPARHHASKFSRVATR